MEEGLSEDVHTIDGPQQQGKNDAYSIKPESGRMLESKPIVIPDDTNSHEGSYHVLANMLEGKDVNRSLHLMNASNDSHLSPRGMDDDGVMLEELTDPPANRYRLCQWFCGIFSLLFDGSLDKNKSDVEMPGGRDSAAEDFTNTEELAASIEQDDSESELLLHLLFLMQDHNKKHATKLEEDIRCLEADIKEVNSRHHHAKKPLSDVWDNKLLKNIGQLENAYFSTRFKIQLSEDESTSRVDKDLFRDSDSWRRSTNPDDPLGAFFGGLCKYARYNKFEVRGLLRTSDFNNSANVICSLSFDRDEDFFATAGVSKKIKIFEFNALLNGSVDIHYPVTEMSNKSKLSCVSWNDYIKNYLASTDYDGVVKLWDATTGQVVSQYMEHEKRAWSVDFSPICPTKLASGSDDCSVKLWGINEKNCLGTIRNIANVCCVQFSTHSTHLLAFGSADYRTYCYDVRNMRNPWCVLSGHEKTVSYVKFLDSETIVTASTDNTLKLWDLNKTNPNGLSTNACSQTFGGHTNEKNFVGLATGDGYIASGSETNEVYAYHRSLPMPITSHKFGSIDPISGRETDDDNGLFVSSVCWRGKSDMVVAANSSGCIKVLQLV